MATEPSQVRGFWVYGLKNMNNTFHMQWKDEFRNELYYRILILLMT